MKVSEKWLREWVNPDISTEDLAAQVTMAGLEVDSLEKVGEGLDGVVVGQIVKAEQHPDADKLRVCEVNVGAEENLQIICGAPNARDGIKVVVATIGSVLPGDFKIKKAKLRGVASFGMLCSESELQLSEEHDGIMELAEDAVLGTPFVEHMQLADSIIDIDLTPNRGDCLSIRGIARDVGVLNQAPVTEPEIQPVVATIDDTLDITLSAPEGCPRYAGRVIRNIDATAKTPDWMKQKLESAGVRAIEPSVDVTNYVLLELGHPMHAFDLARIDGKIDVRWANEGEKLVLLDGQEVNLTTDTLMIADNSKPLAIAGVMGGEHSGISEDTKDVFLESAFFQPIKIAGKARSYGLHTDASHRYERGVDYELQVTAMERATQLLLDIVGGEAGPVVDVRNDEMMPSKAPVNLRRARISRLLGIELSDETVEDILTRLGMTLSANDEGWTVEVPSYRFDISIEEDLIEELVRIYGYNKVPSQAPQNEMRMVPRPERNLRKSAIRNLLAARGYQEAITYTFVEPSHQELINPGVPTIELLNPISSEMSVMRTSIWPALISAADYNLKRQQERVRLFEIGLRFENHEDGLKQIPTLSGVICGSIDKESWEGKGQAVDFYDIKGDVEAVLELSGMADTFRFVAESHHALHPGQSARIMAGKKAAGWIGKLHPSLKKSLDLEQDLYLFELDLEAVNQRKLPKFTELSRYPSIRRDLAVIVDDEVSASQLIDLIRQTAGNLLKHINIFDVYRGEGVDSGRKSIALGLILQHSERTLKDAEVNKIVDRAIAVLEKELNAVLRD
ncbi:phenylalanine--tRNA ligase subunit beta [Pleionea sp. CnH1-48]|uniref:phenylalanine--tRNA ligase subunit beta n=1 Tax=Pleionea sp. CnH1-48 TaxID=2954494 RepID=UPI002098158A|nr:phenylalanine--tRNA ligase subunit beta [Pleionea sp. CnH1-48]MCO7223773.1 phenylalanine--tRNA ligase subunit beta [Pleionea sp. CnH1-48]